MDLSDHSEKQGRVGDGRDLLNFLFGGNLGGEGLDSRFQISVRTKKCGIWIE